MTELDISQMRRHLQDAYDRNSYVQYLSMELYSIEPGEAVLRMPVDPARHTNLYHVAHGGAIASLADTAMGVACASLGRRVVTLDFNINFIRPAGVTSLTAKARVVHNGRQTMVVECEVLGEEEALVATSRCTMFVVGSFDFDGQPEVAGETDSAKS